MATLSICLFSVTFAIVFALLKRRLNSADTVLERVLEKPGKQQGRVGLLRSWQNLAARMSKPERGKANERLRQSFMRAGIRSPNAEQIFTSLKTVGAIAGACVICLPMFVRNAEGSRIVMGAIAGIAGGYLAPDEILKLKIRRRKARIAKALPNTLDLLTICVEAGLGLDQAIVQVSRELAVTYPDISDELQMISLEMRAGKRRADCLRAFGERTRISEVKKLAAVLIQADRFGTSIAQSLRVHSDHLRTERRQQAEEKAAKLGVKLVFPIFFFILPALFVITVGPVIVRIFNDLLPLMNSM